MSAIKDGGSAFPVVDYVQPAGVGAHVMTINGGMTLRDYFAANADMSSLEIQTWAAKELLGREAPEDLIGQMKWQAEIIAVSRYIMADAMLKAREVAP